MKSSNSGNSIRTDELENLLSDSIHLDDFLQTNQDHFISGELAEMLRILIKDQAISKSQLARRAGMSDVYLFQILNGRRTPSRDRLLTLCIALTCTLDEIQAILKKSRYAQLYVKDRRDAIIMHGICKQWSVDRINDALFSHEDAPLI